ncbi:glycosyltransferase family 8 protein [Artomyces pyxidatus]|uniref:Glycosyltransferase family 8 protein n=1 Tax=Artomyces pyxidatus TaxID=48021 RepID=A0ACB8T5P2_9AGAM|nr:glycosyltransferase family 8 protein [Artomyces pyxidatus]
MSWDRYNYLPLSKDWPPSPKWSTREHWVRIALAIVTLLNGLLLWTIFMHHDTPTPLDDYQILKPSLNIAVSNFHNVSNSSRAVVSTLYNELYTTPVATLGHSLKTVDISARRILMYIPGRLSERSLCIVRAAGWELHAVPFIPPPHSGHDIVPRFSDQYTKLNLWTLDQIGVERAVYLDGDTLALRNFDELFDIPFAFAAALDVYLNSGFTLKFNAGVLVLHTSTAEFRRMIALLETARYPLQEAEQAFLNVFYAADVVRLPNIYNGNLVIKERSPELWKATAASMKIVHYTQPQPFLKVGSGIVEGQRLQDAILDAQSVHGGRYMEEVGWWVDAYRGMRSANREQLLQCDILPANGGRD